MHPLHINFPTSHSNTYIIASPAEGSSLQLLCHGSKYYPSHLKLADGSADGTEAKFICQGGVFKVTTYNNNYLNVRVFS